MDDLIVFNNKKFLDYLKETYPSQLTVEKANKLDHLADYLDLTYIIDSGGASFEPKVNNIWFRITRAQHINQGVIQKSSDQLQTTDISKSHVNLMKIPSLWAIKRDIHIWIISLPLDNSCLNEVGLNQCLKCLGICFSLILMFLMDKTIVGSVVSHNKQLATQFLF